ncbi:hypothetical protein E1176_04480, partial [Fulvivirga sp. RKSG066]|uniref:restriction endonuclease subunit S n=1 Tax=Fulvivirga aurantia TaxID=2529383 RepID=UPI00162AA47C
MNQELNLPIGWETVRLEQISLTSSGGTPNRKNSSYYNGDIPWVKSGELKYGVITKTEEYITKTAIENSSAKIVPKGTLLIALYGATVGRLAFLGIEAATNQAVASIMCFAGMPNKYLFYFLINRKEELLQKRIGGAQPNISQTILKDLEVNLPPVEEQHRIVAKIEELFSELDNGVENLKLAQNQLKVYRQALLKHAFEGKLTEEWRKENSPESAEKLLERIKVERQARYEQELKDWKEAVKKWEKEGKKGKKPIKPRKLKPFQQTQPDKIPKNWNITSDWLITPIGNIANVKGGKRLPKGAKYSEQKTSHPYLRVTDFGEFEIKKEQLEYLSNETHKKISRYVISKDDAYISIAGSIGLTGV